jgi:hypothetical protein
VLFAIRRLCVCASADDPHHPHCELTPKSKNDVGGE